MTGVQTCALPICGISSEAELLELQQMGTAAAILGKSLYTGALDLARCVQLVQD